MDTTASKFEAMMWSLDNVEDVVEVRVNPTLYKSIELEAGRFHSKGYSAYKSKLVFTIDPRLDIPIVENPTVKLWQVLRKKDFEDTLTPVMETRSLIPQNKHARMQVVSEHVIEDTTDGERCIILFALEEGMIPIIHHFVSLQQAEALMKEFSEHHTITLKNYHHMTEAQFRPKWISVNRETHRLQKTTRMRTVDSWKEKEKYEPQRKTDI